MVSATFLQVKYRPEFHDEDGLITAVCRELGIAAVGSTNDEASAALAATIRIYCDAMDRRGSLALILEKAGLSATEISVEKDPDEDVVLIVGADRTS